MNKYIVRLATSVYRYLFPYILVLVSLPVYFFNYRKYHAVKLVEKGFANHRSEELWMSKENIIRLVNAYVKAKIDQKIISKPYEVGHLWQEILDTRFKKLSDAVYGANIPEIRNILANFNRDDCGYDTCGGYQYYHRMEHVPFYKYQFINSWYKRLNSCRQVGIEPSFNIKPIGNPVGLWYQGQTVPLCNVEYNYYATKINTLMIDTPKPTICEIGGGVGGQAHEVLMKNIPDLHYIVLDIPEVLLISSYYLMMAFPEKKVTLYGENTIDKISENDIVMLPNFVLPQLPDNLVDLFFNSCSFSEMNYDTVKEYIKQIERICRKYLMHNNHNARLVWWEKNKRITNMIADEVIPDSERFELIYKKPRLFSLLEDTFVIHLFYKARYYHYLYERMK